MKKWLTGVVAAGLVFSISPAAQAAEKRTISVISYLPAKDIPKVQRTINLWNWNSTTKMVLTTSCIPNTQCVYIYLTQPPPGFNGWASPWEGTVKISPKAWEQFPWRYKRALLCHELGHILGLGHTEQGCMYEIGLPDYKPGSYNRSIIPGELLNNWVV